MFRHKLRPVPQQSQTQADPAPAQVPHAARAPASPPRLLTVPEVAQILRTTPKAVYAMVERGNLGGVVRLSRRILINEARFLAWLEDQRE